MATLPPNNNTLEAAQSYLKEQNVPFRSIVSEYFKAKVRSVGYFNDVCSARVRFAKWHPIAAHHLGVLSDTETFALYNTSSESLEDPEQTHPVEAFEETESIGFCYGTDRGWEKFTIYVCLKNGNLLALCPVVPDGYKIRRSDIQELQALVSAEICLFKQQQFPSDYNSSTLTRLKAQVYWLQEVWKSENGIKTKIAFPSSRKSRFAAPNDDSDESEDEIAPTESVFMVARSNIIRESWPVAIQGPFRLSPQSSVDSDYCSVIALHGQPTDDPINCFPVLARSTISGYVEIIVLNQPIGPVWYGGEKTSAPTALLVESLGLGLDPSGGCNILKNESTHPDVLFSCHSSGIHLIDIKWMLQLGKSGDAVLKTAESHVRHIFAVSPTANARVIGTSVISDVTYGHLMLIRLGCGSFELINISFNRVLPLTSAATAPVLSKQVELDSFSSKIMDALEKREKGVIKVSGHTRIGDADESMVKFMIENIKSLQNSETMTIHEVAQLSQDRVELLKDLLKKQQSEQLKQLKSELEKCESASIILKERLKKIEAVDANIKKRAAAILQAVKENQPYLSKAEVEYSAELKKLKQSLTRLKPKVSELTLRAERTIRSSSSIVAESKVELSSDCTKLCLDILNAEKIVLQDSRRMIEQVDSDLSSLKLE